MDEIDVAITNKKDDLLNRDKFAEKLAERILDYKYSDPLNIGIIGKWGSGKTSLINLMLNHIDEKIKKDKLEDKKIKREYIIVHFNPWFFSKQSNLYIQFFKVLIEEIRKHEAEKIPLFKRLTTPQKSIFKKLEIETLEEYIDYLELNKILSIDDMEYSLSYEQMESYESLLFHKNLCDRIFNLSKYKIIVIVDDMDRLMKDEIKQVIRLVKSLADFRNFIYILSFDKHIVAKAIDEEQTDIGDKFLDKIVQIPISVPSITEDNLESLIIEKMSEIYNQHPLNFINEKNELIQIINYLKIFIKDLRDLKRFIHVSKFFIKDFGDELDINDYTLILALQVFEYEIYSSLKEYKRILVDYEELNITHPDNSALINEFEEFVRNSLININFDEINNVLKYLFPYYKNENIDNFRLHKYHKIGSYLHFDKYFTLTTEKSEVPAKIIDDLIKLDKLENITQILKKYSDIKHSYSLWYQLYLLLDEIPKDNIEIFIKAIIQSGDYAIFYHDKTIRVNPILKILFERINSHEKCYRIIKESLDFENNLYTITELIYSISYGYNHVATNNHPKNENESIITKEQIKDLEKDILKKLRNASEDKTMLKNNYLKLILIYWNQYEQKEYNKYHVENYIKTHTTTNEELISFVEKFILETKYEKDIDFRNLKKWQDLDETNEKMKKILEDKTASSKKDLCILFIEKYNEYKKQPK